MLGSLLDYSQSSFYLIPELFSNQTALKKNIKLIRETPWQNNFVNAKLNNTKTERESRNKIEMSCLWELFKA